ncbi:hypothetical protein DFJ77DRAFT_115672 [Powellomyces hirtus]|nr:hypothetical protein DFJ77DRAFT_115672 [Powellomyces hirtus]
MAAGMDTGNNISDIIEVCVLVLKCQPDSSLGTKNLGLGLGLIISLTSCLHSSGGHRRRLLFLQASFVGLTIKCGVNIPSMKRSHHWFELDNCFHRRSINFRVALVRLSRSVPLFRCQERLRDALDCLGVPLRIKVNPRYAVVPTDSTDTHPRKRSSAVTLRTSLQGLRGPFGELRKSSPFHQHCCPIDTFSLNIDTPAAPWGAPFHVPSMQGTKSSSALCDCDFPRQRRKRQY